MADSNALRSRGLFYASLILFVDALAASLGISVLPYFVNEIGGDPATFGFLFSTFAAANIIASLWIGAASDKLGRKPLLVSSLFGMSLGFFGTGLTTSIPVLFAARATIGFFAGVGSTARAYVADLCPSQEQRAKQMAQMGGLMMLGYAAGPPVGAALQSVVTAMGGDFGMRVPFLTGGTSSILLGFLCVARMPTVADVRAADADAEAAAISAGTPKKKPAANDGPRQLDARTVASIGLLLLYNVLQQGGVALFMVVFPNFISAAFGWEAPQFATMMTGFVLGMAVTQMAVFPKVWPKVGLLRLGATAGFVNACASLVASTVTDSAGLGVFVACVAIQVVCNGMSGQVVNVKISDLAPSEKMGMIMGFASTAEQLGRVLCPIGLSAAYEYIGSGAAFQITAAGTASGATCFVAVAALAPSAASKARERWRTAVHKVEAQLAATHAFQATLHRTTSGLDGVMGLCSGRGDEQLEADALAEVKRLEGGTVELL